MPRRNTNPFPGHICLRPLANYISRMSTEETIAAGKPAAGPDALNSAEAKEIAAAVIRGIASILAGEASLSDAIDVMDQAFPRTRGWSHSVYRNELDALGGFAGYVARAESDGVSVYGDGPTPREAVDAAIEAWRRAFRDRRYLDPRIDVENESRSGVGDKPMPY